MPGLRKSNSVRKEVYSPSVLAVESSAPLPPPTQSSFNNSTAAATAASQHSSTTATVVQPTRLLRVNPSAAVNRIKVTTSRNTDKRLANESADYSSPIKNARTGSAAAGSARSTSPTNNKLALPPLSRDAVSSRPTSGAGGHLLESGARSLSSRPTSPLLLLEPGPTAAADPQGVLAVLRSAARHVARIPSEASVGDSANASELRRLLQEASADREAASSLLVDAASKVARCAVDAQSMQARLVKLEAENRALRVDLGEASDLAIAADRRIGELYREGEQKQKKMAAQVDAFDQRLSQLTKLPEISRKAMENARADAMGILEAEVKELSQQLGKRDKIVIERTALREQLQRVLSELNDTNAATKSAERARDALVVELKTAEENFITKQQMWAAEKEKLLEDVGYHSRSALYLNIANAAMGMVSLQSIRKNFYGLWSRFALEKKHTRTTLLLREAQRRTLASSDNKSKMAKEKSVETSKHAEHLSQRIDAQHKQITALSEELAASRQYVSTLETSLRHGPGGGAGGGGNEPPKPLGSTSISELQVRAMQTYNALVPVLHGIKRRLHLESMKVTALPVEKESTEPVFLLVIDWVAENFSFLNHILVIEDRLLRQRSKLTYLSIRIRPLMRRLAEQLEFYQHDAPRAGLYSRQLEGFREISNGIRALKSHVEATMKALTHSVDPEKKRDMDALTSGVEADVATFNRRVKRNTSMQFQFSLQLTRLENVHQKSIMDQVSMKQSVRKRAGLEARAPHSGGAAGVKVKNVGATHGRKSSTLGDTANTQLSSSGLGMSAIRLEESDAGLAGVEGPAESEEISFLPQFVKPPPKDAVVGDPSDVAVEALLAKSPSASKLLKHVADGKDLDGPGSPIRSYEGSTMVTTTSSMAVFQNQQHPKNPPGLLIASVLRGDVKGGLDFSEYERLKQQEDGARRRAAQSSSEVTSVKSIVAQSAKKLQRMPKSRPALRGGIEHFNVYNAAVIPFRRGPNEQQE